MSLSTSILDFAAVSCPLKLAEPYNLAFGALTQFDSFFVRVVTPQGEGYGEVTPLPGYSAETPRTVEESLASIAGELGAGADGAAIVARLEKDAPMVASALACALETAVLGIDEAFLCPHESIPLLALCQGSSPEAVTREAGRLSRAGYATLKMKVGTRPVADDLALLRAAAAGAKSGIRIRIDANQAMTPEAARALVSSLGDLPVELFEQPFTPDMDAEMGPLAAVSPVPLMLDESINDTDDIHRAASLGVRYVKLKLCKHPGMAATQAMIAHAKANGLRLVFGNGVQSALGNRLEARVHREGRIDSASEANGFLKVARSSFGEAMTARGGRLIDAGLGRPAALFAAGKAVASWTPALFSA
jgi:L-Ala-D/L-Glu epimerase / N-acetyl-D-glutamate racemase